MFPTKPAIILLILCILTALIGPLAGESGPSGEPGSSGDINTSKSDASTPETANATAVKPDAAADGLLLQIIQTRYLALPPERQTDSRAAALIDAYCQLSRQKPESLKQAAPVLQTLRSPVEGDSSLRRSLILYMRRALEIRQEDRIEPVLKSQTDSLFQLYAAALFLELNRPDLAEQAMDAWSKGTDSYGALAQIKPQAPQAAESNFDLFDPANPFRGVCMSISAHTQAAYLYAQLGRAADTRKCLEAAFKRIETLPGVENRLSQYESLMGTAILVRDREFAHSIGLKFQFIISNRDQWDGNGLSYSQIEFTAIRKLVEIDDDNAAWEMARTLPYYEKRGGLTDEALAQLRAGTDSRQEDKDGFSDDDSDADETGSSAEIDWKQTRRHALEEVQRDIERRDYDRLVFRKDVSRLLELAAVTQNEYIRDEARQTAANLCSQQDDFERAAQIAAKIKPGMDKYYVYMRIVMALVKARRLDESVEWIEKFRNPFQKLEVYVRATEQAFKADRLDLANALMDRALAVPIPEQKKVYYDDCATGEYCVPLTRIENLARILIQLGRLDEARQYVAKLEAALERFPQQLELEFDRDGRKLSQYEQASMKEILSDEKFVQAMEQLRLQLQLLSGDRAAALEQARKSSNPGAFEELAGFAFRDRLRSEGVSAAVAELDGLDMTPEQRLDLMLDFMEGLGKIVCSEQ